VNTEADTCRKFVVPRLQTAGWEGAPHAINEQRTFTDGRVIFIGGKAKRGRQKRADYILRYRADYPIAVVEAWSVRCRGGTESSDSGSATPNVRLTDI
jgi:type I restriction enzyme, R subunit